MNERQFSIIGCQHAHIGIFISEMMELGYSCAGIYEEEHNGLSRTLADKFGISLTRDKEKLLGDSVDVVGCAAINDEKIDVIELCESRGKHVMVDKPAAVSPDGLQRLKSVIDRGNIQIGMLLTERFHPAIYTLKKQIERGALGDIVTVGMRKPHRLDAASRPEWFFSKRQSGGILIDLLVHDFDLLRWLTGKEIESVGGYVGKTIMPEHPSFYNSASVQVLMEDGIVAQLYADWHSPVGGWTWGDGRIFVTGTESFVELRLHGDPLVGRDPVVIRSTNGESVDTLPALQPPCTITEDFLRRIGGEDSIITHEDILKATEATTRADSLVTYLSRYEAK
ncbi:Gfo/Idh/MocA family oxidoreductase [Paenibacillus mesophilus]|uniref:Gfo/Idh/MocA family protein n=1 Tax=Paenibacillus mesophilus TaxID=2582849 RepID=UPI00110EF475|nr:Gfo/Idh/MocA family oxidoreductase [Paenibacillus mesophilus]TMV49425.1 Gfo/Idh/MocA family oxidoreductase [Paenibacillus mesophilus]